MDKPPSASILERLARLDSAALSDALDRQGIAGTVDGLIPMTFPQPISGRASTVKLAPLADMPGHQPKRHLASAAIEAADQDTIIIIENRTGERTACWGGTLSLAASLRGVRGVIVDGLARDIEEAKDLGFSVYARGSTPKASRGVIGEISWNERILLGTIPVHPGDYIVADTSGIVVIPYAEILKTLEIAEEIVAREALLAKRLRDGHKVSDVMGASYESLLKDTAN
jgi:4-hydroxy-4-methyl-2-oxoglutarate aldolase